MEIIRGSDGFLTRGDLQNSMFHRLEVDPEYVNPIEQHLKSGIYGQDEAIEAVTSAIMRSEAGFSDPNRPKGTFIFLGPTGVGKTEMAKGLARFLYPEDWQSRFKRIDCTDYSDVAGVNKIKGSSNGYVGYGDPVVIMPEFLQAGGVIAFDEIEKAHSSLHRWLLPVLEEGSVTVMLPTEKASVSGAKDAKEIVPTTLDFRNTYIVMTSNVGADAISEAKRGKANIGFKQSGNNTQSDVKAAALKALRFHFASMPEFLGRVGEMNSIVFKDLGRSEFGLIFDKFINEINSKQNQNGLILSTTQELKDWLISEAMKGSYGARGLRDKIDRLIVGQAAELRFMGLVKSGMLIADMDQVSGKIDFWSREMESSKAMEVYSNTSNTTVEASV